jgi:hypothetical protein
MDRKLSIGVLAAALLLSGLLVGVSYGGPAAIADPQVIELHAGKVLGEPVTGKGGEQLGEVMLGAGGHAVGAARWDMSGGGLNWHATIVYVLTGGGLDQGTVVAMGMFRGFNGERLAVAGGTGAYANARGFVRLTVENGNYTHTLHLLP